MGNPRRVEVPPSIAVNSVFAALCEKLGFDPVAKTPELMAARRAIISLLKARGRVEQFELPVELPEDDPRTRWQRIDWSKPLMLGDGTPIKLETGGIMHETNKEFRLPLFKDGKSEPSFAWIAICKDEDWFGWDEGTYPDIRQRTTVVAIDWSQPIEFMDGTEAHLYKPTEGRWLVGIRPSGGCFYDYPEVEELVEGAGPDYSWKVYVDASGFGSNGRQIVRNVRENEWIEWRGGACPVHETARVSIRFGNGEIHTNKRPGGLRWDWMWRGKAGGDIVAYKIEREED